MYHSDYTDRLFDPDPEDCAESWGDLQDVDDWEPKTKEDEKIAKLKDGSKTLDVQAHWPVLLKMKGLRLTEEFVRAHNLCCSVNDSRHPCGDFDAPWERIHRSGQADSDHRKEVERRIAWDLEKKYIVPAAARLVQVLGTTASLDTKKEAVQVYIAESREALTPIVFGDNPTSKAHFFGRAWYDTTTDHVLHQTRFWLNYQDDLQERREIKREEAVPTDSAMRWLQRNASKAAKKRLDPGFKAQVEERLKVVGWSMRRLQTEMRARGWVK